MLGAGFCSLQTCEQCRQEAHERHGELGGGVRGAGKKALCPGGKETCQ